MRSNMSTQFITNMSKGDRSGERAGLGMKFTLLHADIEFPVNREGRAMNVSNADIMNSSQEYYIRINFNL